jgi:2-polyprenyl-3-methyl-5-hydroxy-6-metoxy-1,4-benzoquinol methylase
MNIKDVTGREADPDALKMFSFNVFSKLDGAVTAGMIHLGDRLGLYDVLAKASSPLTSHEIAQQTSLHERWIREWMHNQIAAKLLQVEDLDASEPRVFLSAEAIAVLATPHHPAFGMGMFHRLPQTMDALNHMPQAFATGVGFDYDSHGPEGAVGIERSFEPWNQTFFLPKVLPLLSGVQEALKKGARVADIGCGAGGLALLIAKTFPNSHVVGYDISQYALDRARSRQREEGVSNVEFVDPRESAIPQDGSFDLVCTFDCIHDMTRPQEMMSVIRKAVSDEGTWLLVDIKAHDTLKENVTKNPMAALLYGISVLSCMSSAMSEPEGAGLGTLGLSASRAQQMAYDAGFSSFQRLDVDHSVNAFYEVKP